MAHAEHTVVINRPIADVFDFLADGTNNRRWRSNVLEIERVSGDGVGSIYKQFIRGPGGRTIAGDYRITDHARPRRLSFQVITGPGRPTGTFALAAIGDRQTRLTFSLDLRPTGLMRLAAPMIARQVRTEVYAIDELKQVLERERH